MEKEEIVKSDRDFMRVISIFLMIFALLIFVAVFMTDGVAAKVTNLICSVLLGIISGLFYWGYRKGV